MPLHHTNEASFDIPPQFKDKTMHMFTLTEDGPSEFNVVISRAEVAAAEKLDDFSGRLADELRKGLPGFALSTRSERLLDGAAAVELVYSWQNGNHVMHQRQVITLVQGHSPDRHQALMLAATCTKGFNDEWHRAFDQLLDSVRLRRPLLHAVDVPAVEPAPAPDAIMAPPLATQAAEAMHGAVVFALAVRHRIVHVYSSEEDACRRVDAIEVENGLWRFHGSDGQPLEAVFTTPNTGKIWRSPGKYRLRRSARLDLASLQSCLPQVMRVHGSYPLDTLPAVQAYLERQAQSVRLAVIPQQAE